MNHRHVRPRLLNLGGLALMVTVACCSCVMVQVKESDARPVPESTTVKKTPCTPGKTPCLPTGSGETRLQDRFLAHVALLAHDDLKGRSTGTDGIDLAAGYVAGQFAAAGLSPGGPNGSYFQEFSASRGSRLSDDTTLTFEGCDAEAELRENFLPFGFTATGDFDSDVVFVGYGITAESANHDDYDGIDVDGKAALMLRRQPPDFESDDDVQHAAFSTKIKLARDNGAAAVLIVNQDPGEDGVDALMRFRRRGGTYDLPAIHMKRDLAEELLSAGGLPSLNKLQQQLDETGKSVSAPLEGVRMTGAVVLDTPEMPARNVVGILPGNGPDADQHIVIGAHYDHVGVRRDEVYNGADDNASGTAGVIELAHAFSNTSKRNRSLVFVAFSAEEIGLIGSKHYAQNPTVDRESVVAMINLDMIGRLDEENPGNQLAIQGLGTGDNFAEIVKRRTDEIAMPYLPEASAQGPSDHHSFYDAGVPSLFFNTGGHADLHQPTDDVDKINAEGAVRVMDLIYRIVTDLMVADAGPKYAVVDRRAGIARSGGPRAGGVVIGIMPDMGDESGLPGWRVGRVFPGGSAEKAGMKEGDRILRVAGIDIGDFRDYREATGDKKPGDVVDIIVKRGKEEMILEVELAARGG